MGHTENEAQNLLDLLSHAAHSFGFTVSLKKN